MLVSGPGPNKGAHTQILLNSAVVLARIAPDLFLVEAGGRRLTVKSELPLQPGALVRLQQAGPAAPAVQVEARAFSGLATAFLRSGLPVPKEVPLEAPASKRSLPSTERLVALFHDKGLGLGPALADALQSHLDRRRRRPRDNRKDPITALKASFRPENEAGSLHALQIFNAVSGPNGRWITVPFEYRSGRRVFAATLSGFLPKGRVGLQALALRVACEEGDWGFAWNTETPRGVVRMYTNRPTRRIMRFISALRRKLLELGLELDDTIYDGAMFDGFPDLGSPGAVRSIDARV